MKLYYYRATQGNFGDDLNSWLWEELAPGRWSDEDDGELFCGIGTIIGNDMPQAKRIRVFSSGIGYRPLPADFNSERWNVTARAVDRAGGRAPGTSGGRWRAAAIDAAAAEASGRGRTARNDPHSPL